jgi:hypothetical protein
MVLHKLQKEPGPHDEPNYATGPQKENTHQMFSMNRRTEDLYLEL